jgi:hypothetical protein
VNISKRKVQGRNKENVGRESVTGAQSIHMEEMSMIYIISITCVL